MRWYRQGGGMMIGFMAGASDWDTPYGSRELTTDLALPDKPIAVEFRQGFNTLRLTTKTESSGFSLSSLSLR